MRVDRLFRSTRELPYNSKAEAGLIFCSLTSFPFSLRGMACKQSLLPLRASAPRRAIAPFITLCPYRIALARDDVFQLKSRDRFFVLIGFTVSHNGWGRQNSCCFGSKGHKTVYAIGRRCCRPMMSNNCLLHPKYLRDWRREQESALRHTGRTGLRYCSG